MATAAQLAELFDTLTRLCGYPARRFGAECRDLYDSHEFDLLGWECAETGDFHVCTTR